MKRQMISAKAWRGIDAQFHKANAAGRFYPADPDDVYQEAILAAETAAEKFAAGLPLGKGVTSDTYVIGAAKLAMLNYTRRKIRPLREDYRAIENGKTVELCVGAPMHIRAERAFNHICELLFRIRHTDHALWEKLITVCAALIVADGNHVEAARLAGYSTATWYRKWPIWRNWLRAAAK